MSQYLFAIVLLTIVNDHTSYLVDGIPVLFAAFNPLGSLFFLWVSVLSQPSQP